MIYDIHLNNQFEIDEEPRLLIKLNDFKDMTFSVMIRQEEYESKTQFILQLGKYLIVLDKEF